MSNYFSYHNNFSDLVDPMAMSDIFGNFQYSRTHWWWWNVVIFTHDELKKH